MGARCSVHGAPPGWPELLFRFDPGRSGVRMSFLPSDGGHFKATVGCTVSEPCRCRRIRFVSVFCGFFPQLVGGLGRYRYRQPGSPCYRFRRRWIPYQVAPAVASAPSPIAVTATAVPEGAGNRERSETGLLNWRTGQPRSAASARSPLSGLTTVGWPTASSIGRSVIESGEAWLGGGGWSGASAAGAF